MPGIFDLARDTGTGHIQGKGRIFHTLKLRLAQQHVAADGTFEPGFETTVVVQQHQGYATLSQAVHEGRRQTDVPKTHHCRQMMQRHAQAAFALDLHAQGVVVQPQVGFWRGEVKGIEQLHGCRYASGSNNAARAAATQAWVAWGWQRSLSEQALQRLAA